MRLAPISSNCMSGLWMVMSLHSNVEVWAAPLDFSNEHVYRMPITPGIYQFCGRGRIPSTGRRRVCADGSRPGCHRETDAPQETCSVEAQLTLPFCASDLGSAFVDETGFRELGF